MLSIDYPVGVEAGIRANFEGNLDLNFKKAIVFCRVDG
jgi:hypothetical protein